MSGVKRAEEWRRMHFMKRLKSKSEYMITGVAVLCGLIVAMLLCPPYYPMNDDATMKSILSGAYTGTPDGHAIYMKYPLSGMISLFYRITDRVSWFDIFMFCCFWIAISAIVIRTYGLLKNMVLMKKRSVVCLMAGIVILCLTLFLPQIFMLHYTVIAAMIGSCGLFLLMTGGGVTSIVLLIVCYCIRSQVFFMLMPFLLVVVLWNILDKNSRGILKQILVLAIGIIICMAWNGIMYRSGDWQYYMTYNESRTQLYDYDKLLPYEDNAEDFEAAGISQMQHRLLDEYVLALAEDITPEMMDAAAELTAIKREESQSRTEYLIYCVKEYYYHTRYNDQPYNYIFLGGCLVLLVLLLREKQWLKLALFGCFLGGRSLIWIFLIWRGRFPERIYVSLYFLEIMVLAGMILQQLLKARRIKETAVVRGKWSFVVPSVAISLLLVISGVSLCSVMGKRAHEQAKNHEEWSALTAYCASNPEITYLLDVYSTVDYSGKAWECAEQRENYLLAGGWMSASPLFSERLKALEPEKCCYIVAADRDAGWLFEYCEERLEGIQIEKTDSIILNDTVLFDVYRRKTE